MRQGSSSRRRAQRGVVADDALLELLQLGRRIESEFPRQPRPQLPVRAQRLGAPTGPTLREHQLPGEPLPQRVLSRQGQQFRDQFAGEPPSEVGIDACLDRLQPELVEPRDLLLCERLICELLVGVPAPQRQRLPQHRRGGLRIFGDELTTLHGQPLEQQRVDVVGWCFQHVARWPGQHERTFRARLPAGLERRTQVGDEHPHGVVPVRAGVVRPQLVDDPIRRHHRPVMDQQQRQQRPLLRRAQLDSLAVAEHLQLAEDPELHDPSTSSVGPAHPQQTPSVANSEGPFGSP